MKYCHECGGKYETKNGTFEFIPPSNIPGGVIIVKSATWLECIDCKGQMLPKLLDDEIIRIADERKQNV